MDKDKKIWDAIIIGAGPAGALSAYQLAAAGRQVKQSKFPTRQSLWLLYKSVCRTRSQKT
jgi:predicted oxidoreductase